MNLSWKLFALACVAGISVVFVGGETRYRQSFWKTYAFAHFIAYWINALDAWRYTELETERRFDNTTLFSNIECPVAWVYHGFIFGTQWYLLGLCIMTSLVCTAFTTVIGRLGEMGARNGVPNPPPPLDQDGTLLWATKSIAIGILWLAIFVCSVASLRPLMEFELKRESRVKTCSSHFQNIEWQMLLDCEESISGQAANGENYTIRSGWMKFSDEGMQRLKSSFDWKETPEGGVRVLTSPTFDASFESNPLSRFARCWLYTDPSFGTRLYFVAGDSEGCTATFPTEFDLSKEPFSRH